MPCMIITYVVPCANPVCSHGFDAEFSFYVEPVGFGALLRIPVPGETVPPPAKRFDDPAMRTIEYGLWHLFEAACPTCGTLRDLGVVIDAPDREWPRAFLYVSLTDERRERGNLLASRRIQTDYGMTAYPDEGCARLCIA